uniref:Uncharacterized protein n=1 Tax=Oryza barthii TaxID=65489 RepID=A0A0D3G6D5_9ORYZ
MSRRTKREVAPPPCATANSSASSSGPPGVHIPPAAPYPYGGPLFPVTSHGGFICISGLESRPLGGLVDFIKNTTNPMHHVTEECQLQPINVENGNNGNDTRTEKRLGWSTEEDLRLRDYADAIPLDDEEIPRPMGVKAAKAQRIGKGKGKVQDCTAELEDDIRKFYGCT